MGCVIGRTPEGVRLTGASRDHMMAVAVTCRTFRPPFTVRTVAGTRLICGSTGTSAKSSSTGSARATQGTRPRYRTVVGRRRSGIHRGQPMARYRLGDLAERDARGGRWESPLRAQWGLGEHPGAGGYRPVLREHGDGPVVHGRVDDKSFAQRSQGPTEKYKRINGRRLTRSPWCNSTFGLA